MIVGGIADRPWVVDTLISCNYVGLGRASVIIASGSRLGRTSLTNIVSRCRRQVWIFYADRFRDSRTVKTSCLRGGCGGAPWETYANALRIIQGQMDVELNETGRQQAVMVARRLSREAKPAAVYSSDLKRAAETAQTIATACNVSNLVLNPALRERHIRDLHGLKFDDAIRNKPDVWKAFTSDDRSQEIPGGGESLDQLSERCVSYLNTIASKHKGDRVIVVSHGASIEELCRHADPTSSVRRRIPNTSICVFQISGTDGHWILEMFGDIAHLKEDGFLQHAFGGDEASA